MPNSAHVSSLEAIESFRSSLILYASKARPALEEVGGEILRTRLWLENDQRRHWENQIRRRARDLEEAQSALFNAGLSKLGESKSSEQMAVHRAKRALEEAEEKLKRVRHWGLNFNSLVEPQSKQLDKLHTFLASDLLKATAWLGQLIDTLHAYSDAVPAATPPATPSDGSAAPSPS